MEFPPLLRTRRLRSSEYSSAVGSYPFVAAFVHTLAPGTTIPPFPPCKGSSNLSLAFRLFLVLFPASSRLRGSAPSLIPSFALYIFPPTFFLFTFRPPLQDEPLNCCPPPSLKVDGPPTDIFLIPMAPFVAGLSPSFSAMIFLFYEPVCFFLAIQSLVPSVALITTRFSCVRDRALFPLYFLSTIIFPVPLLSDAHLFELVLTPILLFFPPIGIYFSPLPAQFDLLLF